MTYSNDAANVLYHVVNNRYLKHRSMIFTTNKNLDAWGAVLHDHDLATAILDRVLERGRTLVLDGPSHRTMHLGIDDPTATVASNEPAGLTGKHRQEFPEPTPAIQSGSCGVSAPRHRQPQRPRLRPRDHDPLAPPQIASCLRHEKPKRAPVTNTLPLATRSLRRTVSHV